MPAFKEFSDHLAWNSVPADIVVELVKETRPTASFAREGMSASKDNVANLYTWGRVGKRNDGRPHYRIMQAPADAVRSHPPPRTLRHDRHLTQLTACSARRAGVP